MTEHAMVVAGAGPTGLMLAAELSLAGVDVGSSNLVSTSASTARVPAVCCRARSRCSTSAGSPIGSSRRVRPCPRSDSAVCRSTSATSRPVTTTCWPVAERVRGDHGRLVLGDLGVPILRGRGVVGVGQHDTDVEVELSDSSVAALIRSDGGVAWA